MSTPPIIPTDLATFLMIPDDRLAAMARACPPGSDEAALLLAMCRKRDIWLRHRREG